MTSHLALGCVRQWCTGAALAAAATIVGVGTAHADSTDELIGQAISAANQASAVLDAAPTADLSAQQASFLLTQQNFDQNAYFLEQIGTQQDLVSAGDQPFLAGADEHLVTAAQDLLTSDQALVAADQAGQLSGGLDGVDLGVIEANFGLEGAELNALGDTFLAIFDPSINAETAAGAAAIEPASLLSDATSNYTDANQILAELPSSSVSSYMPAIATDTMFQDSALQDIAQLGASESALTTFDNGVLSDLLNPVFTSVNQGWDQASEAALAADQAVQTAVATGSASDIATAFIGTSTPEYQALLPDLQSALIDLTAHFLTGADPFTVGMDTTAAFDPGIVTDLLSSIGF
jgi:hypothetical protein